MYYWIFKNLYSLQNAQLFIFQLICMQLCKYIDCFLKVHNKQLNQYCLYFIYFFFLHKKKVLKKNGSSSGRADPTKTRVGSRVNPFLLRIKKIKFGSNIFQVESGQEIVAHFAMSRFETNRRERTRMATSNNICQSVQFHWVSNLLPTAHISC